MFFLIQGTKLSTLVLTPGFPPPQCGDPKETMPMIYQGADPSKTGYLKGPTRDKKRPLPESPLIIETRLSSIESQSKKVVVFVVVVVIVFSC